MNKQNVFMYIILAILSISIVSATQELTWLKFDGNLSDSGTAGNNVDVNNGGTLINTGMKIGTGAIEFVGQAGYCEVSSPTSLPSGNANRTYSIWLYHTVGLHGGVNTIFGTGVGANTREGFSFYFDVNSGGYGLAGNNDNIAFPSTSPASSEWYFYVITYDSNNTVTLYRNDINIGQYNFAGDLATVITALGINTVDFSSADGTIGIFDDMRIYDVVLNETEISWLYNSGNGRTKSLSLIDEPCVENWIQNNTACNGFNYTISYYDSETCGTYDDLPVNNGTIVNCAPAPAEDVNQAVAYTNNALLSILVGMIIVAVLIGIVSTFLRNTGMMGDKTFITIIAIALVGFALLALVVSLKMLNVV
jgi:hypothetical protein